MSATLHADFPSSAHPLGPGQIQEAATALPSSGGRGVPLPAWFAGSALEGEDEYEHCAARLLVSREDY